MSLFAAHSIQYYTQAPITLMVLKEEERKITDSAIKGGKLLVIYGLKENLSL